MNNNIKITLDDETADVLRQAYDLTGLSLGGIITRTLPLLEAECHEVLALVDAHPELRDEAANLFLSYGPEPIEAGIKRIAPPDYMTLSERFEQEVMESLTQSRTTH